MWKLNTFVSPRIYKQGTPEASLKWYCWFPYRRESLSGLSLEKDWWNSWPPLLTCFLIFHEKHPFQNAQDLKMMTKLFDSPCSCWMMEDFFLKNIILMFISICKQRDPLAPHPSSHLKSSNIHCPKFLNVHCKVIRKIKIFSLSIPWSLCVVVNTDLDKNKSIYMWLLSINFLKDKGPRRWRDLSVT